MAPHSSTLAWKIPWMEEPGRLQSMGSVEISAKEKSSAEKVDGEHVLGIRFADTHPLNSHNQVSDEKPEI